MNLLVFNLRMDADDAVLGHSTAWVNALAKRCEHISVITMSTGRIEVEPNVTVHSLGKERGYSEPRRLARFYRITAGVLRRHQIDACFAHMAPLFSSLFAPVARTQGIPILLWYAHSNVTPTLRVAHALADRCVTSTKEGFRIPSSKLVIVGQGIDTERFHPPETLPDEYRRTVLSVGRVAPVKRIDEMLEALGILRAEHGEELRMQLFGGPQTPDDHRYLERLRESVGALGLDRRVSFEGAIPYAEVPLSYHVGGWFLNLSETGSIDKAILEAAASGCIPLSRNSSFRSLAAGQGLEWLVPGEGPAGVAECIAAAMARSESELAEVSGRLREGVVADHSLDHIAEAIIANLVDLRRRRPGPATSVTAEPPPPPRPRALFVGGTRYELPLPDGLERKWGALEERLELRVVGRSCASRGPDARFRLIGRIGSAIRGPAFYAVLACKVLVELRRFRPQVVVAQSPFEALACLAVLWAGGRPKLIVELHGDYRTATRNYGGRLRRILTGAADRAAVFALRRADAVRALSRFTAGLAEAATGRAPAALFYTYFDFESFLAGPPVPLPQAPAILWVGVLEPYKNPERLAHAWRLLADRVPQARLTIVGDGPMRSVIDDLQLRYPDRVTALAGVPPAEVARLLDESTLLAMSSESEGVPRVIMEAMLRSRPVVATAVGGIPDIIVDGHTGVLVDCDEGEALADGLTKVLSDPALADRLSQGALGAARAQRWSAAGYASSVREMIDRVLASSTRARDQPQPHPHLD